MKEFVRHGLIELLCFALVFSGFCAGSLVPPVVASASSSGSWTRVLLDADTVWCVAVDPLLPTTLYAGTLWKGILRSTDRGDHWQQVITGLTGYEQMSITAIVIDRLKPSNVYVVSNGDVTGRIFRSTDWGDHWQLASTGLPAQRIRALAIDPLTPTTLYASFSSGAATTTDSMCVFRTDDAGDHWKSVSPSGFNQPSISLLAVDCVVPTTIYAAGTKIGYWGDYQSLFIRSTDRGEHWQDGGLGQVTSIAFDPITAGTSYVAVAGNWYARYLWRVQEDGMSKELPTPPGLYSLAVDPLIPTTLYVCSGLDVFRSLDSGEHWENISTGLADPEGHTSEVACLAIDPLTPSTLYAATLGSGLFRYNPWPLATAVVPVGAGSIRRTPELGSYAEDASVTLVAAASPGWHFTGWSGDVAGGANPITVVMHSSKAISANFAMNTPHTLAVSVVGSGAVSRSPDQPTYGDGSVVTLTATPLAGWYFQGWYGDVTGSSTSSTVTIDGDKKVTATFAFGIYSLTTSTTGSGYLTKAPNQPTYPSGTAVTVTAAASPGYTFTGWSGDLTGTANPAVLNMDSSKSVTAVFAEHVTYSLAVSVSGKGSVGRSPDLPSYEPGTAVTFTAAASPGYIFTGWSGDLTGTANPAVLNMDSSKSVTARFTPKPEENSIIPSVGPGGHISPGTVQYLQAGASMTFWVTPDTGYHLVEVVANGIVQELSKGYTFGDVHGANTIHASFAPDFCKLTIAPLQHGTIARSPSLASYSYGAVVTLTAAPASGYRLVGWIGAVASATNLLKATVKMDANKTVSATFQAISAPPPAVTLSSPSNGSSIGGSTATLSWEASLGATSYRLDLAKSSVFANATAWTISGTSRTASALSLGTTYYWRVAAVNTRGTSPWSPVFHFTTRKPNVTLTLTLRLGSSQMLVTDGKGASDSWTLDAAPLLGIGSRTLVPIRAVAEAMGGTVEWNSSARAATVVVGGNTLVLTLGRNTASLNGEATRIDTDSRVVPTIINARTMLPLRFVAESLGAQVSYNSSTKTIVITCPVG